MKRDSALSSVLSRLKSNTEHLPHLPGVYQMLNETGKVLYVGKAVDLKKRVRSYFALHALTPRIARMIQQVTQIDTTVTRSESEALLLEYQLIQTLSPRYNILFRDDKSYPYLRVSTHPWAQLSYSRHTQDKRHQYFGPFPHSTAARHSMQILQKVFQLRTCEDTVFKNRSRPCLLYQTKYCSAPCTQKITPEAYQAAVHDTTLFLTGHGHKLLADLSKRMHHASDQLAFEEAARLRNQIQALTMIQSQQFITHPNKAGNADVIAVASMGNTVGINLVMIRGGNHWGDKSFFPMHADPMEESTVVEAFLMQHYSRYALPEWVVVRYLPSHALQNYLTQKSHLRCRWVCRPKKEKLVWLQMAEKNIQLALMQKQQQSATAEAKHLALEALLGLNPLKRIECFDVSHTQGEATVAACVVYDQQSMQRGAYRTYRIRCAKFGDDYAAMEEALKRRYTRLIDEAGQMPDLLLIDGGKGQVAVALTVLGDLSLSIPVVGIAKGEERQAGQETLFLSYRQQTIQLPPDHLGFLLLQYIRDEAHRCAIGAHRLARARVRQTSLLETIAGIGAKRRRLLLTHFEGLKGIAAASLDDIAGIAHIGPNLAQRIYRVLHESR